MLSIDQTIQVVRNTKDYHAACIRNGYLVPDLKSRLCTKEFLMLVRSGEVYVPRLSNLKISPCPEPPTTKDIQAELIRVIKNGLPELEVSLQPKFDLFVTYLQERAGDKSFMLNYLSTITEGTHPYFGKDYKPPKRQSMIAYEELKVDNSDGFFTGLPQQQMTSKRQRANTSLFISKEMKDAHKLAKLKHRAELIERQIQTTERRQQVLIKLLINQNGRNQQVQFNQNLASFQTAHQSNSQQQNGIQLSQVAENIQLQILNQQLNRMNVTRADSEDRSRGSSQSSRIDQTFDFTPEERFQQQLHAQVNSPSEYIPNFISTRQ